MNSTHDTRIKRFGRRLYLHRLRTSRLRSEFHYRIALQMTEFVHAGWLVDVGCGSGLLETRLAERLPAIKLVGVDIDRQMLLEARAGSPQRFVRASAAALCFRDSSLDAVVSSASVKDWADPEAGFREIARVLKPGGTALIYDFLTTGPGSKPKGFLERFGLVSYLLRLASGLAVRFSLEDARRVARSVEGGLGIATVALEEDLGVVRVMLRKPGGRWTRTSDPA